MKMALYNKMKIPIENVDSLRAQHKRTSMASKSREMKRTKRKKFTRRV